MIFVLSTEWEKIDYWRINKFMMLYREIVEEIIKLMKHFNWSAKIIEKLN